MTLGSGGDRQAIDEGAVAVELAGAIAARRFVLAMFRS